MVWLEKRLTKLIVLFKYAEIFSLCEYALFYSVKTNNTTGLILTSPVWLFNYICSRLKKDYGNCGKKNTNG